jgi:hypothetical protein
VFVRVEPWLQAGKYAAALMSQIPRRNGWQAEMIAAYMRWRDPPRQAQDQLRLQVGHSHLAPVTRQRRMTRL